jgi:hypothetical protein
MYEELSAEGFLKGSDGHIKLVGRTLSLVQDNLRLLKIKYIPNQSSMNFNTLLINPKDPLVI